MPQSVIFQLRAPLKISSMSRAERIMGCGLSNFTCSAVFLPGCGVTSSLILPILDAHVMRCCFDALPSAFCPLTGSCRKSSGVQLGLLNQTLGAHLQ